MVLPRNTGQDMITTTMQLSHFLHKTSINKRPMEGNTMLQFLLHGAFIVLRSLPSDELFSYRSPCPPQEPIYHMDKKPPRVFCFLKKSCISVILGSILSQVYALSLTSIEERNYVELFALQMINCQPLQRI